MKSSRERQQRIRILPSARANKLGRGQCNFDQWLSRLTNLVQIIFADLIFRRGIRHEYLEYLQQHSEQKYGEILHHISHSYSEVGLPSEYVFYSEPYSDRNTTGYVAFHVAIHIGFDYYIRAIIYPCNVVPVGNCI